MTPGVEPPSCSEESFTPSAMQAAAAAAKKAAEEKQRAQDRALTATIELSERFYARPGDLYECFTNPGRVQAFSQSPAQVSLTSDPSQRGLSTLSATGLRIHWSSLNRRPCNVFLEPSSTLVNGPKHLQVEPRVGGTFSIYGGSVEAKFTALEPPSKIGMDWRFKNWPDNTTSKVLQLCFNAQLHGYQICCLIRLCADVRKACIADVDLD